MNAKSVWVSNNNDAIEGDEYLIQKKYIIPQIHKNKDDIIVGNSISLFLYHIYIFSLIKIIVQALIDTIKEKTITHSTSKLCKAKKVKIGKNHSNVKQIHKYMYPFHFILIVFLRKIFL